MNNAMCNYLKKQRVMNKLINTSLTLATKIGNLNLMSSQI